jgi:hypothetical protein
MYRPRLRLSPVFQVPLNELEVESSCVHNVMVRGRKFSLKAYVAMLLI